MHHRRQDTPTPWVTEPDPMVPQPTETGRTVLRLWIEEQLRMLNVPRDRRRHHHLRRRHRR